MNNKDSNSNGIMLGLSGPEENKTINKIASGYKNHVNDAKNYMLIHDVNANYVIDNTAWIIYDQKGYEKSVMTDIN